MQGTVNGGMPSLNDLAVDGTLNTTNQPTNHDEDQYFKGVSFTQHCVYLFR